MDGATVNGLGRRVEVLGDATVSKLTLASTGETITLAGGALKGIEEIRDTRVPEYLAALDTLTATLVSEVNLKHSAGFGLNGVSGTEFFTPTGTTAQTIEVNSAIIDNTDLIVASADLTFGNNQVALDIADLRLSQLFNGGTKTMEEFYSDLIGQIGSQAKETFTSLETQRVISDQLSNREGEYQRGLHQRGSCQSHSVFKEPTRRPRGLSRSWTRCSSQFWRCSHKKEFQVPPKIQFRGIQDV